ncbi:MAG TPA: tetratricopeptide repeat protein, partial [Candidatus Obscuribacterales bacterium]
MSRRLLAVILASASLLTATGTTGLLQATRANAASLNEQLNVPINNGTQGDLRDEADRLVRAGGQYEQQGSLEKAIASWQQAVKLYQRIGDVSATGLTYDFIGLTYAELGRLREA